MAEMPYICLYKSYIQTLAPFTDAERGRIMMAMLNYSATGEMPVFEGNERYIWPSVQGQIDRDLEAYLHRSFNCLISLVVYPKVVSIITGSGRSNFTIALSVPKGMD